MKHFAVALLFAAGFFSATYAMGQIYTDKADIVKAPMDQMAVEHNAMFADVPGAGDDEIQKPQDERYNEMTAPMEDINQRHFNYDAEPRPTDR